MIKLIAAITMLIDHIGAVLFPSAYLLRFIGRLSMPLFGYGIARGFHYTRSRKKYLLYVLLFACLSQPAFSLVEKGLNIGFTWLISLLLLAASAANYPSKRMRNAVIILTYCAAFALVGFKVIDVDYNLVGVVTPLLFYFLIRFDKDTTMNRVLALLVIWAYYVLVQRGDFLSLIFILDAFIITAFKNRDRCIRVPKWFYYFFYPGHIIVLLAVRQLTA